MAQEPTRVLLVEDDPGDATLVRLALQSAAGAYDVETVERFNAALARLALGGIDAVLLDVSSGGAPGLEAFEAVHALAPDVPIIVLAGPEDEARGALAVKEGAQDYLVKGRADAELISRSVQYALERHRMQRSLLELSTVDELTGLLNRRGFVPLAEHHLKMADRSGEPVVLLFIDLDGLKSINETFGKGEGSRLLADAGAVLREAVRDADILARIGGDEFCVLLTGTGAGAAPAVLTRLVEAIATHNARSGRPYALSLSIGSAAYDPANPLTLEELIRQAGARMDEERRRKHPSAS